MTGAANGQQEQGNRVKRSLAPIVALVGVVTGGLMLVVLTRGPVDDSNPVLAAAALYDSGPALSGVVCVGGFPIESADIGSEVVAAIEGGTSLADAARVYSIDPNFAASGGILTSDGQECLVFSDVSVWLTKELRGVRAGTPVMVVFGTDFWVVVTRPYASLSPTVRSEVLALLDVSS